MAPAVMNRGDPVGLWGALALAVGNGHERGIEESVKKRDVIRCAQPPVNGRHRRARQPAQEQKMEGFAVEVKEIEPGRVPRYRI
jgi:hypothetical protein